MTAGEWARQRIGQSAVGMMDLTDDEMAAHLAEVTGTCETFDAALRRRGATVTQRAAMLIGAALSPITTELQRREDGS